MAKIITYKVLWFAIILLILTRLLVCQVVEPTV